MVASFSLYQLLVPAFALLMLARAFSKLKRGQRTVREFIALCVIWGSAAAFALFPDAVLVRITQVTGIKDAVNAIVFFCLVVLLYSVASLYMKIENLEQNITDLVRRDALSDSADKHK